MKRLLLTLFLVLFASTTLAGATMGLYFDLWPGVMAYTPTPASFFDVYLYLHASNYYVTALEYQITTPLDPLHTFFAIVEISLAPCLSPGGPTAQAETFLADYPVVIGPHPESGQLWGTFFPNNDTFPIIGLQSTLCPVAIGVENSNWGAIKSLYR